MRCELVDATWRVVRELAVVDDVPVSADRSIVAVLAVAGAGAGATAAVPAVAPCGQPVAIGGPPRLPPRIALPVAVQPAPGVDVGGFEVVGAVDCASATPPAANAAAAARLVNHIFLFMAKLLVRVKGRGRQRHAAKVAPPEEPPVRGAPPSGVGRLPAAGAPSSYEPIAAGSVAPRRP
jgi:hypothetical protein